MKIEEIYNGWFYPNLLKDNRDIIYINPNSMPPVHQSLNLFDYRRVFVFDDNRLNPIIYVMDKYYIKEYETKDVAAWADRKNSIILSKLAGETHGAGDLIFETIDALPVLTYGDDNFRGKFLLLIYYPDNDRMDLSLRMINDTNSITINKYGAWSDETRFIVGDDNIWLVDQASNKEKELARCQKDLGVNIKQTILLLNRMKIYE